jgi:hypothetical protein
MADRIAIKRLTASDCTLFEAVFRFNDARTRKHKPERRCTGPFSAVACLNNAATFSQAKPRGGLRPASFKPGFQAIRAG